MSAILKHVDEVIRSKRKTYAIEVLPGGKVIVRAPLHASDAHINAVLANRSDWLIAARKKMTSLEAKRQPHAYIEGEQFWYLGKQYPLHLTDRITPALRFDGQAFWLSRKHQPQAREVFIEWYREATRTLVSQLISRYHASYHFRAGSLRITSAKTRWGSCSAKNDLNFAYRLSMAQPSAVEYVVVHELTHTRIKNHSAQFWQAVATVLPSWKKERTWLHKNGALLTLD